MVRKPQLTMTEITTRVLPILTAVLLMVFATNQSVLGAGSTTENASPTTEPVTFTCERAVLAGTLYLPAEGEPFPAVVLLTGSNRGPRGPLLSRIAEHFAQHGIAVLHYDSAGTGQSTGNALVQSLDDRASEAISAVRFLRRQRGINPDRIGLWGGSEGASIALLAAATYDREVAFAIPVSGGVGVGGGSIFEQMYYSAERFVYANKLTVEDMLKIVTLEQLTYAFMTGYNILEWSLIETRTKRWPDEPWPEYIKIAKMRTSGRPLTAAEKQIIMDSFRQVMKTFIDAKWSKLVPWQKRQAIQILNLDAEQFFAIVEMRRLARDWDWDLRHKAEKVKCRVLAMLGEDDADVPPNLIATRLRQYLTDANNRDFEIVVLPGANHYLTKTGSGWTGEFVPGYLDKMTSFIHGDAARRTKK